MRKTFICDHCGKEYPKELMNVVGEDHLCNECIAENTVVCTRCGERIYASENAGDNNTPLCQSCYDREFTTCYDCGRVIHNNDAYYESDDDYEARCYSCHCRHQEDHCIHDYYYKPEPIFYGEGNRYFGVELEVDDGGETEENARIILNVGNRGDTERLYVKHDGSLNDGFEIVSHACSLRYHCDEMPWSDVLGAAKQLGFLSHQAGTAGLHVHVGRVAFGETEAEQDECIARVLYFFEKHWEELLKFSRRTRSQLDQWAARYGLKEHPKDILDHAKGNWARYTCVNLTNRNTIEFRIFRGTLKYNTLIATLQLLDRICDVALYFTDEEIKDMSWTTFVAGCSHLPELVQYLKERRLYINEPIETEVEV